MLAQLHVVKQAGAQKNIGWASETILVTSRRVTSDVFQVGGSGLSGNGDCLIYAVDCGDEAVAVVDCGVQSYDQIARNIRDAGMALGERAEITIFLTHAHIDHVGAAHQFKAHHPHARFVAHALDQGAIEGNPGTEAKTAASWYGIRYEPVSVDHVIEGDAAVVQVGKHAFRVLHTPGHTPGSISLVLDVEEDGTPLRVLFGQDIHGPFSRDFDSDLHQYAESMEKLLALEADVLCEGHYGIYRPKGEVEQFIQSHLNRNRP